MSIDLFFTQNVNNGNGAALGKGAGPALGGTGISADFLDLLLGQIEVKETQTASGKTVIVTSEKDGSVQTETADAEALLKEKGDLALLQLALLGQNANENIEQQLAELKIEKLDNRVNQLTKLIDHLTNGLPANVENGGTVDALVARLQERIENLETRIELFRAYEAGEAAEAEAPFPLLIATGLNPSQLTKITDRIEEIETKLGRELTVDDLIAGVGNIIPAPGSEETLSPADFMALAQEHSGEEGSEDLLNLASGTLPSEELAAQLNNINVGGAEFSVDGAEIAGLTPKVDGPLSNAAFNALKGKSNAITSLGKSGNGLVQANLSTLSNSSTPLISGFNGSIALPENWQALFAEAFDALGIDIDSGLPISHTMLATHISTSVPQAGQTHPATQMVASQMGKAAQNGAPSDMTIQLDPPELGRVDVKLEFGPDNTIKAHVIAEKPETYLLLQKDALALERALQEAGLDTDGGSLSFELADDSYAFNNNGDGSNGHANGGDSDAAGEEQEEIINTTMTWDVDPETGHVHYNIMA